MAGVVIVDTDILIDVGRGDNQAVESLEQLEANHTLAVSIVTQMELVVGCQNKAELQAVEKFLQRFQVVPLNEMISIEAVNMLKQYCLSHGLLIADALVAATAIRSGYPLISKNQRDYRFIAGLDLLAYP